LNGFNWLFRPMALWQHRDASPAVSVIIIRNAGIAQNMSLYPVAGRNVNEDNCTG
jgi:hypothetical protein